MNLGTASNGLYLGQVTALPVSGTLKYIYNTTVQQSSTPINANIATVIPTTTISGFTSGKQFIFDLSFTYACINTQNNVKYDLFMDESTNPIQSIYQFTNDQSHACHSVKFMGTSTTTSHTFRFQIQIVNNSNNIYIDSGDYYSFTVTEIE